MGIFDSITDFLGTTNSNAQDALNGATPMEGLGNINLGGGLAGGMMNFSPNGQPLADVAGVQNGLANPGFNKSPLNQQDWSSLNGIWGNVRRAANFGDINWKDPALKGASVSPEAQQFLTNNWGNIRRAANLGDINWAAGGGDKIIGSPAYAQQAMGGAGGTPGGPGSASGSQGMPGGNTTPGNLMQQFLNLSQNQSINPQAQQALQGSAMRGLSATPDQMTAQYLDLMRQQAAPQETRDWNNVNQNLFSRGRLGADDTMTGDAYRGVSEAHNSADIQRQLAAIGVGNTQQQNLFTQGIQSLGAGNTLQNDAVTRSLGGVQGYGALGQTQALPLQIAIQLAQSQAAARQGIAGSAANQNDSFFDMFQKFGQGFGSIMGGIGGGAGAAAMSDVRLKHDIEFVGTVKGRRWYTWKWPNGKKGSGLMAHENPDIAVIGDSGYMMVDYSKA